MTARPAPAPDSEQNPAPLPVEPAHVMGKAQYDQQRSHQA